MTGAAKVTAVFSPVTRSKDAVLVRARPGFPIALGTRPSLTFGVAAVAHSPSVRERLNCALSSSGRTNGTEQAGLTAQITRIQQLFSSNFGYGPSIIW